MKNHETNVVVGPLNGWRLLPSTYSLRVMNKALILYLIGLALLISSCAYEDPDPGPESFDFSHVKLALRYHETPTSSLLAEVSATPAAAHLKRHSDRTGYYPANATTRTITENLLADHPSQEKVNAVRTLIKYAENNPARQQACMLEAAAYLPTVAQPINPIYITWGYDIGVAMNDRASLNFAHHHFLENREEIWFYGIHEMHHSGVMQVHPMPKVGDIDTVQELYDFVRYATFLEGLAVHSAREARRKSLALGYDSDYLALEDREVLDKIESMYWRKLSFLKRETGVPLDESHWQIVEEMSSGDRLWYITGATMAAAIEDYLGRQVLLELIHRGPDAFFAAYKKLPTK